MRSAEVALITCCTKRKRLSAEGSLRLRPRLTESPAEFATRWAHALAGAAPASTASDLYAGRGFSEIRATAERIHADVFIVSAGLGLAAGISRVPAYDLTIANGPDSLLPWLRHRGLTPADWWAALTQTRGEPAPLAAAIRKCRSHCVLLSLPSTYLAFVQHDLATLSVADAVGLRILTSPRGQLRVPPHLQRFVMPYDSRLEGTALAGTQADFPQRALSHFAAHVMNVGSTVDTDVANVVKALRGARRPVLPTRIKQTDEQIAAILRQNWWHKGGGSAALLRHLRDEAKVQCEQGRFRLIWKRVGEEYAA